MGMSTGFHQKIPSLKNTWGPNLHGSNGSRSARGKSLNIDPRPMMNQSVDFPNLAPTRGTMYGTSGAANGIRVRRSNSRGVLSRSPKVNVTAFFNPIILTSESFKEGLRSIIEKTARCTTGCFMYRAANDPESLIGVIKRDSMMKVRPFDSNWVYIRVGRFEGCALRSKFEIVDGFLNIGPHPERNFAESRNQVESKDHIFPPISVTVTTRCYLRQDPLPDGKSVRFMTIGVPLQVSGFDYSVQWIRAWDNDGLRGWVPLDVIRESGYPGYAGAGGGFGSPSDARSMSLISCGSMDDLSRSQNSPRSPKLMDQKLFAKFEKVRKRDFLRYAKFQDRYGNIREGISEKMMDLRNSYDSCVTKVDSWQKVQSKVIDRWQNHRTFAMFRHWKILAGFPYKKNYSETVNLTRQNLLKSRENLRNSSCRLSL